LGGPSLRRILAAGLLVTGPLVVTSYVLWIVFAGVDGILQPLFMRVLHFRVPGLGLLALFVLVLLTGLFASHFLGQRIVRGVSARLERLPLWSPIYRAVRDISEVLLSERSQSFRRVAALEFPRPGLWALVFVTSEGPSPLDGGTELVNVFLPTTPNPTTGFFLMVPRDALRPVDMSIENAVKLLLSGGAAVVERAATAAPAGSPFSA
jgi:uncharacterized membrane protein